MEASWSALGGSWSALGALIRARPPQDELNGGQGEVKGRSSSGPGRGRGGDFIPLPKGKGVSEG